jgi:non-specific serine/threonine protein kinase
MESFEEALLMCQDMGRQPQVVEALEGMASLAGALEKDTRTAHLWGAAAAARQVTDIALAPGERELHEPYLSSARFRLGETAWEEALAAGRTMSLEEAAEYALSKEKEPPAHPFTVLPEELSADQPPVALTPREKEVALFVAKELSNSQIASQLMLSKHTVATHIRNILKKLGLRSRTQITIYFTQGH